jgi:hypothetical protein
MEELLFSSGFGLVRAMRLVLLALVVLACGLFPVTMHVRLVGSQ